MTQTSPSGSGITTFMAWVWAGLLILGGAGFLLISTGVIAYSGPITPLIAGGSALLSLPFAIRWITRRQDWWAALVAWIFVGIAAQLMVMFVNRSYDQFSGMSALLLTAVPFMGVFAANRSRWWALIPAYILIVSAGLLGLTIFGIPLPTMGAFALLAAALPFWAAYMVNRLLWWTLVPAGLFSAAGVILLAVFSFAAPAAAGFYVILYAALAVVSLAIFLTVRRFDWAIWLAVGFALAAALAIWFPSSANLAIVALTLGLYIAFKQIDATQKSKQAAAGSGASTQPPAASSTTSSQPAQPATPSSPPPSPPTPAQPASPPTTPTPADLDRAASEGKEVQGRKPVVDFRPLDPFAGRNDDEDIEDA